MTFFICRVLAPKANEISHKKNEQPVVFFHEKKLCPIPHANITTIKTTTTTSTIFLIHLKLRLLSQLTWKLKYVMTVELKVRWPKTSLANLGKLQLRSLK